MQASPQPGIGARRLNLRAASRRGRSIGFTLIELLVVIGILAVLGVLTVVSAQRLSTSSRVSAAVNTVTNALQVARAYAIRSSKLTVVIFRPIWDANNRVKPQQTEVMIVESTGESYKFGDGQYEIPNIAERFVPVQGVKLIRLPAGIKVAGPDFENTGSATLTNPDWVTQAELSKFADGGCGEAINFGRTIAVMFAPDGSLVLANPRAGGADTKSFADLSVPSDLNGDGDPQDVESGIGSCANGNFEKFWMQDSFEDECNFTAVPFLSIYDDRAAREVKALDWSDESNMRKELCGPNGFISTNGQQVNFNRYTGVAEVQQ